MSAIVKYETPDLPAVGTAQKLAANVIIDDQTTYELASQGVAALKTRRAEIEAMRKSIVDPINKAKDAVQAIFVPVLNDYDEGERIVKCKMISYVDGEDRKRREAQAAADKAAREIREAAEAAAKKAEKTDPVVAQELREIAALTPPVYVAETVTQVGGNSIRKRWKATLVDLDELIRFVATHPEHRALLSFNQSAADKLVGATEGRLPIGGVTAAQVSGIAVRAA
jgi:hypothetical protein